jgi:glycine/D-amino acid oxidase-like deaminating enzyme
MADGGKVVRGRVMSFGRDGNRITSVKLADSQLSAKAVVIAAGGASGMRWRSSFHLHHEF